MFLQVLPFLFLPDCDKIRPTDYVFVSGFIRLFLTLVGLPVFYRSVFINYLVGFHGLLFCY